MKNIFVFTNDIRVKEFRERKEEIFSSDFTESNFGFIKGKS